MNESVMNALRRGEYTPDKKKLEPEIDEHHPRV
jgi:hypothetical protein